MGLDAERNYLGQYLPGMLVGGAGVGMILPSFTASAVMTVPPARLATGIAGETMFRQVGAALGVATFVALFGTPVGAEVLDSFDRSFAYMGLCWLLAGVTLLVLALLARRESPPDAPSAQPLAPAESTIG